MRHWQPERPDRPPRMERWIFVLLLVQCGMLLGLSASSIVNGLWYSAIVGAVSAAIAGGWVRYRVREAGWP